MKKLLVSLLFLFLSVLSYAPTKEISDEEIRSGYKNLLFSNVFSSDTININSYPLVLPIWSNDSVRITSNYGSRIDPITKRRSFHNGIDFAACVESFIISTANGVVEEIKYGKYGYGNYVVIKHENNIRTIYAHLSRIDVKEGDFVKRFDQIGLIGKTGRATGIHLHYEVRYNNMPIDPRSFFNIKDNIEYLAVMEKIEEYVKTKNTT